MRRTNEPPPEETDANDDGTDDDTESDHEEGSPEPILEFEDDELEGPQDETTITLRNEGDGPLWYNRYNWRLKERVDGTWVRIAPWEWPEPEHSLKSGETYTRTLTVAHDDRSHEPFDDGTPVAITNAALESAADGERERDRLVFERTTADDARRLTPEHVAQSHPLWNALPILLEEDFEKLVLYAGPNSIDTPIH